MISVVDKCALCKEEGRKQEKGDKQRKYREKHNRNKDKGTGESNADRDEERKGETQETERKVERGTERGRKKQTKRQRVGVDKRVVEETQETERKIGERDGKREKETD